MTYLLDVNILIALTSHQHVHYERVEHWFSRNGHSFATCPITEGGLIRFLVRDGISIGLVQQTISSIHEIPGHEFWPDSVPYNEVDISNITGHRQVTDTYLAAIARANGGILATLDSGLASVHSDVAELIEPIES